MDLPFPTSKYHSEPTPFIDPSQPHLTAAGKIVLVTGGGTSIGASTVEAFAIAKAKHVFLVGRRLNLLEGVKSKVFLQEC
jgi:FlaA1/EpsC-like NDP-sugar epimerase